MSTFEESTHPRETTGRFASKTVTESDGGLEALAEQGAPIESPATQIDRPGAATTASDPAPLAATVVEPINGLVARESKTGRWALHDPQTGTCVFGRGMENRRRHTHTTREEAEQWARESYPLIRRTRDKLDAAHPRITACPRCGGPLDQELDGGVDGRSFVVTSCARCDYSIAEGRAA